MADYTSVRRVRLALGGRGSGNIPKEIVQQAIDSSSAMVASMLGKEIAAKCEAVGTGDDTPVAPRTCATWIAAKYAYLAQFGKDADSEDDFSLEYNMALDWLKELRTRRADISEISLNLTPSSTTQNYTNAFNRDNPLYWEVDPDQEESIVDDRD